MSIVIEVMGKIFITLAFDFILYITGIAILRVSSFGLLKYKIHSYSEYKAIKKRTNTKFIMPYIIGILFYTLVILSIAWFN